MVVILRSKTLALPIFRAAKNRPPADLDGFLGFPFPKNAQERLLRRLHGSLPVFSCEALVIINMWYSWKKICHEIIE